MRILLGMALLLGLAVPVVACSEHGDIAEGKVDDWMGGQTGTGGFSVDGYQNGTNGNSNTHWVHDTYAITVTLPGGSTVTYTEDPDGGHGWDTDHATELEDLLANEAENLIKQFDVKSSDYIG